MSIYTEIVNKEKREATMWLYGEIGRKIDGDLFALELATLDGQVDTIHLRINCPGGLVIPGLSIVSAMLSAKAFIHVYIDGVAASMGAVVAICGDKVSMMDYAKKMIHDASFGPKKESLSDKEKKALNSITDILRTILNRRGLDKEKIAKLMTEETWFTAEEAKALNLIDEIISSKRKNEFKDLSTDEILSRIGNEYKPNNEHMADLKKIAASLGLPEAATEEEVLNKIKERETAQSGQFDTLIAHYMAIGERNGTVTDKNKERLQKLAKADFSLFVDTVMDVPEQGDETEEGKAAPAGNGKTQITPNANAANRLSGIISQGVQGKQKTDDTKTWDWYQKNNPQALEKMETENPDLFNKLLDAYENTL